MGKFFKWLSRNLSVVRWAGYILSFVAVISVLLWAFKDRIEEWFNITFLIDLEALFAIVSGLLVLLNQLQRKLLDDSEYSPAHALATGYVNNFVAPVITQLMEDGVSEPKLCIYRPADFDEL